MTNVNAAALLVQVKTKLGKVVPDYAKKAAASDVASKRAHAELLTVLQAQRSNVRKQLFAGNESLRVWWEANQVSEAVN